MQAKLHIKKGDTVKAITGNSKGQQGKVLSIDRKNLRALVEGLNIISKHTKPKASNTQGGIVKQEASIHISNLMLVDSKGNATKVGRKLNDENKIVRYSKKSGEVIK
jgi:large subunit ribosomal protein L24